MKVNEFQKFLLKSAILMMACDNEIHNDEISELKSFTDNTAYFLDFEIEKTLDNLIKSISENISQNVNLYVESLNKIDLKEKQKNILLEILLKIIMADNIIDKNEINFFQQICNKLKLQKDDLLINFPDFISIINQTEFIEIKQEGAENAGENN